MPFFCLFIYLTILAVISRLPLKTLIKRISAIVPFILFLFLLRLIFIQKDLHQQLSFFLFLALRTGMIITAFTIFFHTTPFPQFIKSLATIKVPSFILTIYFFTHNFIYIMLREGIILRRTWQSRTTGRMSIKLKIRGAAILVRQLILNILQRSENLYISMVSRGYQRHIPFLDLKPVRRFDTFILIFLLVFYGVIVILP